MRAFFGDGSADAVVAGERGSEFLIKALNRLLKLSSRKHKDLRSQLQEDTKRAEAEKKQEEEKSKKDGSVPAKFDADPYFKSFMLACQSGSSKLVENSLDFCQKLMARGWLTGASKGLKKDVLIEDIVETICECANMEKENPDIEVQILKALLTGITANGSLIHDQSLLVAIRTAFNIFVCSTSQQSQVTARASLTQIVTKIVQRFEMESEELPSPKMKVDVSLPAEQSHLPSEVTSDEETIQKMVEGIIRNALIEAGEAMPSPEVEKNEEVQHSRMASLSPNGMDVLRVFKALLKFSLRPVEEESVSSQIPTKSRILSLELILGMLERCGPRFRSTEQFIDLIKRLLSPSIVQNASLQIPSVSGVSLRMLSVLILQFKRNLKTEIAVFFQNVLLRILDPVSGSLGQQKLQVLKALKSLCRDAQTIVDIYLNYDCEVGHSDVFEKTLDRLAAVACGKGLELHASDSPELGRELRMTSLDAMVAIITSMVEWSKGSKKDKSKSMDSDRMSTAGSGTSVDDEAEEEEAALLGLDTPHFIKQKQMKTTLKDGISLFNKKAKKGIEYLIEAGMIERSPGAVCDFFETQQGLDKAQIGDFMGEPDDFSKAVLYEYTDRLDFTDMQFDEALRHFLEGFRLPGEAQKIDRMMEKFAERYVLHNPNSVFATADCAYILAYSVIMLNTDLHNPAIKNKMTKEGFVRNNRGINDNADLPRDFLEKIYDKIGSKPIKMNDEGEATNAGQSGGGNGPFVSTVPTAFLRTVRRKPSQYDIQTAAVVQSSLQFLKDNAKVKTTFYRASGHSGTQHIASMLSSAWPYFLKCFDFLLEKEWREPEVVSLCLQGIRLCVNMGAPLGLESLVSSSLNTLTKHTHLLDAQYYLTSVNLDCVKCIFNIVSTNGDYIGESWKPVLQCISKLAFLQMVSTGNYNSDALPRPSLSAPGAVATSESLRRSLTAVDEHNAELVKATMQVNSLDWVFLESTSLCDEAIVDFVVALAAVSKDEMGEQPVRTFSLQKIVEIAAFNMSRIRLVWSRIWNVLGEHFSLAAKGDNQALSTFAVDSLRQLTMKFLEKAELCKFQFQRDFLRPFEDILMESRLNSTKEYVLHCIRAILQARLARIKSGWKNIFSLCRHAAKETASEVVGLAYEILNWLFREQFEAIKDVFMDFVHCTSEFRSVKDTSLCLGAVHILGEAAKKLAGGELAGAEKPRSALSDDEEEIQQVYWIAILTGLSGGVNDSRIELRTRVLNILFDALRTYGASFSESLWQVVFQGVLFPIFDDVHHATSSQLAIFEESNDWLSTTCFSAMHLLIELVAQYFTVVSFVLAPLLQLLESCVKQPHIIAANIGITCLGQFVELIHNQLDSSGWVIVSKTMVSCILNFVPAGLPEALSGTSEKVEGESTLEAEVPTIDTFRTQMDVLPLLLGMLDEQKETILNGMDNDGVLDILNSLGALATSLVEVESSVPVDFFSKDTKRLSLLDSFRAQSAAAHLMCLRLAKLAYLSRRAAAFESVTVEKIAGGCRAVALREAEVLEKKSVSKESADKLQNSLVVLSEVAAACLRELQDLGATYFKQHANPLFDAVTELVTASNLQLRKEVLRVMDTCIRPFVV